MTIEEEIMQEANIRYSVSHPFIDIAKESFIEGAQLAHKTIIDKACEWLDANFPEIENTGSWYKESFIEQFKKVMKE